MMPSNVADLDNQDVRESKTTKQRLHRSDGIQSTELVSVSRFF